MGKTVFYHNALLTEEFYTSGHAEACTCPVPCMRSTFPPTISFTYTSQYDTDIFLQVKLYFSYCSIHNTNICPFIWNLSNTFLIIYSFMLPKFLICYCMSYLLSLRENMVLGLAGLYIQAIDFTSLYLCYCTQSLMAHLTLLPHQ